MLRRLAVVVAVAAVGCGTALAIDDASGTPVSPEGGDASTSDAVADSGAGPCTLCRDEDDPGACALACDEGRVTAIATAGNVVAWITASPPTVVTIRANRTERRELSLVAAARGIATTGTSVSWLGEGEVLSAPVDDLAVSPMRIPLTGAAFGLGSRAGELFAGVNDGGTTTLIAVASGTTYTVPRGGSGEGLELAGFAGAGGTNLYVAFGAPAEVIANGMDAGVRIASGADAAHLALTNAGLFWTTPFSGGTRINQSIQVKPPTSFATLGGSVTGLGADNDALYAIGTLDPNVPAATVVVRLATDVVNGDVTLVTSPLTPGAIAAAESSVDYVFFVLHEPGGASRVMRVRKR